MGLYAAVLLVITFLPLRETNDAEMSSLLLPTQVFALGDSDLALDAGFDTLRM